MTTLEIIYFIFCSLSVTIVGIIILIRAKTEGNIIDGVLTLACGITVLPALIIISFGLVILFIGTIIMIPIWIIKKFKNIED